MILIFFVYIFSTKIWSGRITIRGGYMFKIEIRIGGEYYKTFGYSNPVSIREIIEEEDIPIDKILAFKLDRVKFEHGSVEVSKNHLLDIVSANSFEGRRIYQDSAIFILMKAYSKVFPKYPRLVVKNSLVHRINSICYWDFACNSN